MRRHYILLPVAALLVTLPLLVYGCSCGHDFGFHLQSWLEAANQFRHGTLNPHWAFSPAYNAGEPRFIFYPPLSWTLGALLTLVFPIDLTPALYTWIVLTAAGFTMHRLARQFVSADAALLASAFYIANPYMLFNAFERTAYAELLAAVWLPLLFLSVLRETPTVRGVALPVALLWLTNAPAAVMGCYALVVVILVRLSANMLAKEKGEMARLAAIATTGTILGLGLASFYLIPAAYERRFVQIAMAIIPNMRFQDNFLFGHTGDVPHDRVLHIASLLSVGLLAATAIGFVLLAMRSPRARAHSLAVKALMTLTCCIALLLLPLSTPLWQHLPDLAFLQFPWRLLSVLVVILTFALGAVLDTVKVRSGLVTAGALLVTGVLTLPSTLTFRQGCDVAERPGALARLLQTHHGVPATDEYTPRDADNDVLRSDDPAYWLSESPADFAPGTIANPAANILNYDTPPPPEQTISAQTPMHFVFHANARGFLILNLRDYPNWDVTVRDPTGLTPLHPARTARDDGLIAVELNHGGDYPINIVWHRTPDQLVGLLVSAVALVLFGTLTWRARSRRIEA